MNDEDLREPFALLRDEDRAGASSFVLLAPKTPASPHLWLVIATAASIVAVAGALGMGTVWGATSGYASGRLEADRLHAATANKATTALASLRSELGQARWQLGAPGTGTASAAAVEANLRTIETRLERIETDLKQHAMPDSPAAAGKDVAMHQAMAVTCATLGKVVRHEARPSGPSVHAVASRSR